MSSKSPLSVAICAYNGFEYTKLLIGSLRRHSRYEHELLVYSDGSSDGTLEWLRSQPDITFEHDHRNRGICTAMNRAARMASREYLFFPNTDHVVAPGWDEALLERLAPRTVVSCQCIEPGIVPVAQIFHSRNCGGRWDEFDEERFIAAVAQVRRAEAVEGINYPFAISRDLWEEVGGLDERFNPGPANDPDLFYRLSLLGVRMVRANDALVYHFSGKSSRLAGEVRAERSEWHEMTERNEGRFVEKWGERYRYSNGGLPDPGPEARRRWQSSRSTVPISKPDPQTTICVAIDATAATGEVGGIGGYTIRLIEALLEADGVRVLCLGDDAAKLKDRLPTHERMSVREWNAASADSADQLAKLLSEAGAAIFHGPSFALPAELKLPGIVTIHDLAFLHNPAWYPPGFADHMLGVTQSSLERASAIIAVSDFVRDELRERFPKHADKVLRIYEAPVLRSADGDLASESSLKGGVPYLLAVGTRQPRKNAVSLVRAFARLRASADGSLKLVLVGGASCEDPSLFQTIQELKLESAVILTHTLREAELASLYAKATLLVFPSLDEGFGLPALEAMAAGVPVVATRAGALPEIVGDAALLVPPDDPEVLAKAIDELLGNEVLRADFIRRGLAHVRNFSWSKTAKETIAVYRKAMTAPAPPRSQPIPRRAPSSGPLRVAVDARLLGMDHLGTGRYTRRILDGLLRIARDTQWVFVGPQELPETDAFAKASIAHHVPAGSETLLDPAWEQFTMASQLSGCDVLFSPTGILPVTAPCRGVAVVHDLGFEDMPDFYESALRTHLRTWIRKGCGAADRIVAVSSFTRDRIGALYSIPDDRIRVVHHGSDPRSKRTLDRAQGKRAPYVLCVSSFEPNKNHALLVQAFAGIAQDWSGHLVLAGRPGRCLKELDALVGSLGIGDRVEIKVSPDDDALNDLYAKATLFAFPSLYEGFGLPLLEAMAAGLPVMANTIASCPEILGDAGILVEQPTPEAWSRKLLETLSSPPRLESLGRASQVRAAEFSWDKAAEHTWNAILECVGRP